jgi:hypothetical protein
MRCCLFLLVTILVACNEDLILGVPSPGAPARIMTTSRQFVGGHEYIDTLMVDSASARYDTFRCSEPFLGGCAAPIRTSATVTAEYIDLVFGRAQSRDFQRLDSEYSLRTTYNPPDGGGARLTVTVGERTRIITWTRGAELPGELTAFLCQFASAGGSIEHCLD